MKYVGLQSRGCQVMSLILSRVSLLGTPPHGRTEEASILRVKRGVGLGGFGQNSGERGVKKLEIRKPKPKWKNRNRGTTRAGMLEQVANTIICTRDNRELKAFVAMPDAPPTEKLPVVLMIHEFWGLSPEICGKAKALANEVGCITVAPDTYRGQSTRFIPKAIFLALTTAQNQVNHDLDEVIAWIMQLQEADSTRVGIVGFCYGGGKALRYGIKYKKAKAIAVIYGSPVLDIGSLTQIEGSVLGIYGDRDTQYPTSVVEEFRLALSKAGVENVISIYKDQGHAFWHDMDQVMRQEEPQLRAWIELTTFMKNAFST